MSTYPEAPLPAEGAVVVLKRADDFILLVGDGKGPGEGGARWHLQAIGNELVEVKATGNMGPKREVVKVCRAAGKKQVEAAVRANWKRELKMEAMQHRQGWQKVGSYSE